MKRRICVITGTRADYGLLRWLMHDIQAHPDLQLQVVATGMHLAPELGHTLNEILADGFTVDLKVDSLLSSDTPVGMAKSMGMGMIGFADALSHLQPDLILVLGDRIEIFAAVSAALVAGLPVAHLHGGESTEGAFDDALRHAITKMSHLHFVANEVYRQRVIQMGESPERVWTTGGMGVDAITRVPLMSRAELEAELDFELGRKSLLVTFHPSTLSHHQASAEMNALLQALDGLKDTQIIFTHPNADTQGRTLAQQLLDYAQFRPHVLSVPSLGQRKYLSCIAHVDAVVGNSSSGLTEVPTFHKPTINIGNRQKGRLAADSVIHCEADPAAIARALQQLDDKQFQRSLAEVRNPYGQGKACERIIEVIRSIPLKGLIHKSFHEVNPL